MFKLKFYSSLFLNLLMTGVMAEEIPDPTKPAYQEKEAVTVENKTESPLVLTAILTSKKSKWVTINGEYAKQGQTILKTVKIIKIRKNAVIIKHNGTLKTLYLLPSFNKPKSGIYK